MFIVGLTISLKNVRSPLLIPFSKNKYLLLSEISSSSTFVKPKKHD